MNVYNDSLETNLFLLHVLYSFNSIQLIFIGGFFSLMLIRFLKKVLRRSISEKQVRNL